MKHQLLETRKGLSQDKSGLPPSLLSINWSRRSEDLESGSKEGVVSLDVGRSLKLSFSLTFLHEALLTLTKLKKASRVLITQWRSSSRDSQESDASGRKSPEFATPNTSEFASPQASENISFNRGVSERADPSLTELMVTTNQVIIELVLSSLNSADTESESAPSPSPGPAAAQEAEVSLQGEVVTLSSKSFTKEGLVLAWQSISLTVPPTDKLTQTSELAVDNLQLLTTIEGLSSDIVPPVHCSCLVAHYKPRSAHDL